MSYGRFVAGVDCFREIAFGRGDRIRTYDILLPKQARYRLRYTPDRSVRREPALYAATRAGQPAFGEKQNGGTGPPFS